jgi:hypothetical protein
MTTYARVVFHLPFPLSPDDRSRTGAEVMQVRLDQLKLNSLADQRPRGGWSRPRIVETSDILYFIHVCRQYLFMGMF